MSVDVDTVIDVVAREMTEVEPAPSLRARVLERIEKGHQPLVTSMPRWAWAGAAAAVVLAAAAAVWLARPVESPATVAGTVAEQRAGEPRMSPALPPQEPTGSPVRLAARPAPAKRVAAPATAAITRPEARDVAEATSLVPPLSEIEPLRFAAVEPDPLHVAAVEVAPFPAMTSIDIPGLGPGSNDTQSADQKKEKRP